MTHFMCIQVVASDHRSAVKAEDFKQHYMATPQRLSLKELPCPVQQRNCHAQIPVPDGLTMGEWIDRETSDKAGQFVVLQLLHQER